MLFGLNSLIFASFIQHIFLKYCFFNLTFLMLSSPFLQLSIQKTRIFHFKFQDPLLAFQVISNTTKISHRAKAVAISHMGAHTHTQGGVSLRNWKKKKDNFLDVSQIWKNENSAQLSRANINQKGCVSKLQMNRLKRNAIFMHMPVTEVEEY